MPQPKRRPNFLFFIIIFLAFIGLANFVVFDAVTFVFPHIGHAPLGICLAALSAGFITMMFLGSKYYNFFTRSIYLLTATWMGAFSYFFFASVFVGLLALLPSSPAALAHMSTELFVIATFISLYGLLHAHTIKIKRVTVTLPHLPPIWKNRKVMWISDIHLGQIHGKAFADKVVKKINRLHPDIVFIGGDLFDGTQAPPLQDFVSPFKDLRASLGTYFITGNHEEFGNDKAFLDAVRSANITILQDEKIVIDDLQIIGVDYRNANDKVRLKETLSGLDIRSDHPSILLKHVPDNLDVAQDAGISLQISGHTHYGQQFPFGLIASRIFKGYAYGLKEFGSMQVYTSSGVGTWGPPLRFLSDSEIVLFHFE